MHMETQGCAAGPAVKVKEDQPSLLLVWVRGGGVGRQESTLDLPPEQSILVSFCHRQVMSAKPPSSSYPKTVMVVSACNTGFM